MGLGGERLGRTRDTDSGTERTIEVTAPSVFVGSSGEGLEVARAVQYQLQDVGEIEVWNEGVFGLTSGTLESLVQALDTFDFAVLVLTPDDLIVSRGVEQNSARDNVLIELGLFMGRLGRGRTFVLYPRDSNVKIPSDLAGVTLAAFSKPSDDTKLVAAVGPACLKIRNAIKAYSKANELGRLGQAIENQEQRFQDQGRQLERQQEIINQLVKYSMSASIFHHLCGIAILKEYKYSNDDATQRELYFLRDNGFIRPKLDAFLVFNDDLRGKNLVEKAEPTPIGWLCVRLRKEEIPSNMLNDKENLRVDPNTL
jgi:predicted nucleotide-binding protein